MTSKQNPTETETSTEPESTPEATAPTRRRAGRPKGSRNGKPGRPKGSRTPTRPSGSTTTVVTVNGRECHLSAVGDTYTFEIKSPEGASLYRVSVEVCS